MSFLSHSGLNLIYKRPKNGNRLRVSEKLAWPILSNTMETQKWVAPVKRIRLFNAAQDFWPSSQIIIPELSPSKDCPNASSPMTSNVRRLNHRVMSIPAGVEPDL